MFGKPTFDLIWHYYPLCYLLPVIVNVLSPVVEISLSASTLVPGKAIVIYNAAQAQVLWNETDRLWLQLFISPDQSWLGVLLQGELVSRSCLLVLEFVGSTPLPLSSVWVSPNRLPFLNMNYTLTLVSTHCTLSGFSPPLVVTWQGLTSQSVHKGTHMTHVT